MKKRTTRGRLSSIEQLPPECAPIIASAAEKLRDRDLTQQEIYEEFFLELQKLQAEHHGDLEFTIPSRSAFNRYAIRLATLSHRLDETRRIAEAISDKFDAQASDDLTLIAAEAIKTLIFEVLTSAGESGIDPKGAMNLANALRAATQAQGLSTIRRQKVEKEFASKVDDAISGVANAKGISEATAQEIRAKILGIGK